MCGRMRASMLIRSVAVAQEKAMASFAEGEYAESVELL